MVADFLTQLDCLPHRRRRLFCLLGSTIGNLSASQRNAFLGRLADAMQPGDEFLLGVDLVKPVEVLERAYNDAQGVTAEFNRNILSAINNLAGTNFDPGRFEHVAFFNVERSRIEMHLRATGDMHVHVARGGQEFLPIGEGEMIHTEDSHKFTIAQARDFLESAGLEVVSCLHDANRWFSLLRARLTPRGRHVEC